MDERAFWASVIGSLSWPVVACIALYLFREQISALFGSLRRFKVGPVEGEVEIPEITSNQDLDLIISNVSEGAHSYQYLRDNTGLTWSDAEFERFIAENREHLLKVRVRSCGQSVPGCKLTPKARATLDTK